MLLNLVTHNNRNGMRLTDLYKAAGLERPTTHRLLQALVEERLLRQSNKNRRYYLGPAIQEMGVAASPAVSIRDVSNRHLKSLCQHVGDTVVLNERSGLDAFCTARFESESTIQARVLDVGRRRPLTIGASAHAMLSAMDEDEVNFILRVNRSRTLQEYPNYDESAVRERVAVARRKGYVLGTVLRVPDVRSIAMPLRDANGTPIAGISVSTFASLMTPARETEIKELLGAVIPQIETDIAANVLPYETE